MNARNDDGFTFVYPVIVATQLDFEQHPHQVEILLTGHIVHEGHLMCGETREEVMSKAKATKEKNTPNRAPRVPVCPVCQENYKSHPDSAWFKFTHAMPIKAVGIEIVSRDVPAEIG